MTTETLYEAMGLLDQIRYTEDWLKSMKAEFERIKDVDYANGFLRSTKGENMALIPSEVYKEVCKMVLDQHELNLAKLKDQLDKL